MSRYGLDHIFGEDPYYPGSRQRREPARLIAERVSGPFDGIKPRVYQVKGQDVEFFTVGHLADALNRSAVTIRKWEHDGVIPKATFLAPNPKRDQRAKRRLYTRAQAEGIVRIATEEGLMKDEKRPNIKDTNFTDRVTRLFRELQK